jgi:hypothetical protein
MYEDKAKDFMRTVNEYIKTVRSSTGAGTGAEAGINNSKLNIKLDSEGYPILPITSWEKINKDELEKLYRSYITYHYREFDFQIPV